MKKRNYIIWFVALLILVLGVNWVFSAAERDRVVMVGGTNIVFAVYDEDDMASDDPLGFATQSSIKQFVINGVDVVSATVTETAGSVTGFVISAADGNTWLIDLDLMTDSNTEAGSGGVGNDVLQYDAAGVIVYLPTVITQAMDGQPMTFIYSSKTGTTDMVLWAGATKTSGVSVGSSAAATGVTNSALIPDATGNAITLIPSYDNQIFYIQGSSL